MSSKNDKVRELIAEQAGEWFVANRGGLSSKEHAAFAEWLRSSPVHVEEYLAHSVIARDMHDACVYSDEALADLIARARMEADRIAPSTDARSQAGAMRSGVRAWRPTAVAAATCAAVGMGWFAVRGVWPLVPARPAAVVETRMATRHGEQVSRRLADNSVLHLNTDSAVTIRYSATERIVILHAGEADFEIVHDAGRPFHVVAGATQVIDLGTEFDVLLEHGATVVTVAQGSVAVSPSMSAGRDGVHVGGGQQLTVVDGEWPRAKPITVDAQHVAAWLHRQIAFDHTPLEKVAAEFNRYAPKPIEIVSQGLQELQISGVFTTDDPAAFIAFLRSLDHVRVEETATRIRVFYGL